MNSDIANLLRQSGLKHYNKRFRYLTAQLEEARSQALTTLGEATLLGTNPDLANTVGSPFTRLSVLAGSQFNSTLNKCDGRLADALSHFQADQAADPQAALYSELSVGWDFDLHKLPVWDAQTSDMKSHNHLERNNIADVQWLTGCAAHIGSAGHFSAPSKALFGVARHQEPYLDPDQCDTFDLFARVNMDHYLFNYTTPWIFGDEDDKFLVLPKDPREQQKQLVTLCDRALGLAGHMVKSGNSLAAAVANTVKVWVAPKNHTPCNTTFLSAKGHRLMLRVPNTSRQQELPILLANVKLLLLQHKQIIQQLSGTAYEELLMCPCGLHHAAHQGSGFGFDCPRHGEVTYAVGRAHRELTQLLPNLQENHPEFLQAVGKGALRQLLHQAKETVRTTLDNSRSTRVAPVPKFPGPKDTSNSRSAANKPKGDNKPPAVKRSAPSKATSTSQSTDSSGNSDFPMEPPPGAIYTGKHFKMYGPDPPKAGAQLPERNAAGVTIADAAAGDTNPNPRRPQPSAKVSVFDRLGGSEDRKHPHPNSRCNDHRSDVAGRLDQGYRSGVAVTRDGSKPSSRSNTTAAQDVYSSEEKLPAPPHSRKHRSYVPTKPAPEDSPCGSDPKPIQLKFTPSPSSSKHDGRRASADKLTATSGSLSVSTTTHSTKRKADSAQLSSPDHNPKKHNDQATEPSSSDKTLPYSTGVRSPATGAKSLKEVSQAAQDGTSGAVAGQAEATPMEGVTTPAVSTPTDVAAMLSALPAEALAAAVAVFQAIAAAKSSK